MTNVMPPLSEQEYNALRENIEKNGVLVPIEIDEETGELLDGHHRQKICSELGIEAPKTLRRFGNDAERTEHALILNMMRRHLGPISWAESFKKLLEVRGVKLGQGANQGEHSATVAECCSELGVPERTARRRLKQEQDLKSEPDLATKVDKGEMDAKDALRKKREREQLRRVKEQDRKSVV